MFAERTSRCAAISLTVKSSRGRANVHHTLVLLDGLRLVVQLGCHTVARLLDARSQLAAASAQPAAVTTRRVRVARFSIVHAYPESGYVQQTYPGTCKKYSNPASDCWVGGFILKYQSNTP
jgi:hypothetical protein